MSDKFKYLTKKPMVIINEMLDMSKQGIRTTSPNHQPLLRAMNDAIGEAIEKVLDKFGQRWTDGTWYKYPNKGKKK